MSKMRIKKGDRVRVISGKDAGKEGKILKRNIDKDTVVVIDEAYASFANKDTSYIKPSIDTKGSPRRACQERGRSFCVKGNACLPEMRQGDARRTRLP